MIPVYVISIKGEDARREKIAAHLKERGIDFQFFDAVDGRKMNVLDHPGYDGVRRRACNGVDLKPGELGCILSHRTLYEHCLKQGHDHVLILEDDARLHEDTKDTLEALRQSNYDFDIIRLFGSPKVARGTHRKIIPLIKDFWLVRLRTLHGGTHATFMSKSGLEKLVKATDRFSFPIDIIMNRTWETGIISYTIQPGLSVPDESFESLIGTARHDKTTGFSGWQKCKYKVTRALFKLNEALAKAWTYYANAPKDLAARKKFG